MFKNNLYVIDVANQTNHIENIRGINGTFFQKNINERKIPMIQMMREEGLKAFEIWDKKVDKIKY